MKTSFAIFIAFFLFLSVSGQTYKYKIFNQDNGLNNTFITSITQDVKGYLWIGTGDGLTFYDGDHLKNYTEEDGLASNYISSTFESNEGLLLIGHNQGDISVFDYSSFSIIKTEVESEIVEICQDNLGNIWTVSQSGVVLNISQTGSIDKYNIEGQDILITSLEAHGDHLYIGSSEGIFAYRITGKTLTEFKRIEDFPNYNVTCIRNSIDQKFLWVSTAERGIFKLSENNKVDRVMNELLLENIQSVYEDKENNLWISTFGTGLFKLIWSQEKEDFINTINFNEDNGLPGNFIKTVYQDREKNLWIGTFGAGLAQRLQESFLFFQFEKEEQNNIRSVFVDGEHFIWLGTDNGLAKIDQATGKIITTYSHDNKFIEDKVNAIIKKTSNELWVGTGNNGVYIFDKTTEEFKSLGQFGDALSNEINFLKFTSDTLWIATNGGLIKFHNDTAVILTIAEGLMHNVINHIYNPVGNQLYISSPSNSITLCDSGMIKNSPINQRNDLFELVSITADKDGYLWLATASSGIIRYHKENTLRFSTNDGLKSDYCYGITSDDNNNIWVTHQGGISKYMIDQQKFKTYDKNDGITASIYKNAIDIDSYGNIWFGSDEGLIKYVPENDYHVVAPLTDLIQLKINDRAYEVSNELDLSYGNYKIEFQIVGVSLRSPDKVRYKYILEGLDNNYYETSKNVITYNNLSEGKYTLKVYSGIDGNWNEDPMIITIEIAGPFWKKWWVITLFVLIVSLLVYVIIVSRFRRLKRRKEILEKELQIRTKEILEKNVELKVKNQSITDSLRYAQSLQNAILPDDKFIKSIIPESFVFYKPKDIVSGDFFRIDRITEKNKVIFACADCTGHGVPAAFMSMIGNTVIRDILNKEDYGRLSNILDELNSAILKILRRNVDDQRNEGMDIVLCELDFMNKKIYFSSALRPIVLVKNGKLIWKKGSRFSIGGHTTVQKIFEEIEFDMEVGDMIYLFSDGYIDQFGGPNNKKFKTDNFQKLIKEIHHLPMKDQHEAIIKTHEDWVKNSPKKESQLDDILVIGLKITSTDLKL